MKPKSKLPGLEGLTFAALLVNAGAYFVYFFLVFSVAGVIIPLLAIAILTLLAALLVASRRMRTAPLLGAVLAAATSALDLAQPESVYNLEHPAVVSYFLVGVIILASALVAIAAGGGAAFQSYLGVEKRVPGVYRTGLVALTGIVVGLFVASLIVSANPLGSASASTTGEATVHMGPGSFMPPVVLVPKGGKLLLVDDGQFEHVLSNGMWNENGTATPRVEPGAPLVHELTIDGGSKELGPFNTVGVYHLYCTIHQGMTLTIVVQ
jgi:hypothetical protein